MIKLNRLSLLSVLAFSIAVASADETEDAEFAAWKKSMEATQKGLEDRHKKTMHARVDELIRICNLDDDQVSRFRLAAKGAVEYTVDAYMNYQEKQWRRRKNGNRGPNPSLSQEDQNPALQDVWLDTIAAQLNPNQEQIYEQETEARSRYYATTMIRQIVQQLDDQIRFSAKQRAALTEHLETSILLSAASGDVNPRSIQITVYKGLADVPDEPIREVLSDDQFSGWKSFKDRYVQAYKNR